MNRNDNFAPYPGDGPGPDDLPGDGKFSNAPGPLHGLPAGLPPLPPNTPVNGDPYTADAGVAPNLALQSPVVLVATLSKILENVQIITMMSDADIDFMFDAMTELDKQRDEEVSPETVLAKEHGKAGLKAVAETARVSTREFRADMVSQS